MNEGSEPNISVPAAAEIVSFSDVHLNRNGSYIRRKREFISAIFSHPGICLYVINGDLADNQFGRPEKIIAANRSTFDMIADHNVLFLEGNHDPFEWWDGSLDRFIPPERQFKKALIRVGSTLISTEHGNVIQPALHERLPWLPRTPLFGYVGLYGGTLLRVILRDYFKLRATFLPDNTHIFNCAEDHLPAGVWGMFGHTHNAEVAKRCSGGLLLNTGSIGTAKAEYAILNERSATHYTLHPEP